MLDILPVCSVSIGHAAQLSAFDTGQSLFTTRSRIRRALGAACLMPVWCSVVRAAVEHIKECWHT